MYMHSYKPVNRKSCRYKNFETLRRVEKKLFKILINVLNDSTNNRKYEQLAKFLIRRISIWKPTPYFPIYLSDIPRE